MGRLGDVPSTPLTGRRDAYRPPDPALEPGERLIGKGRMAWWKPVLGSACEQWRGWLYVTDRRVFFLLFPGCAEMDLRLEEIGGFSRKRHLGLFTMVTIHSRAGGRWAFTGFPAKRLPGWLREAGIPGDDMTD